MVKRALFFLLLSIGFAACDNGATNNLVDQGGDFDSQTNDYGVEGDDSDDSDNSTNTEGAPDTNDSLLPTDGDVPEGQSDILTDDDIIPDEISEGSDPVSENDNVLPDDSDIATENDTVGGDDGSITPDDGSTVDLDIQPDEIVITEVAKRWATDSTNVKHFGNAVAVFDDLAIVGAEESAFSGTRSGSAYIFERGLGGANNWGERKILTPSDSGVSEYFGRSVAINSDHAFVVKIRNEVDGGDTIPSVYFYRKDQGGTNNWGFVKKLSLNESIYSFVVVLATDELLFVGAPGTSQASSPQGQVTVYSRNNGGTNNWGLFKTIVAQEGHDNDHFGTAMALDGDRLVVGSSGWSGGGVSAAGAVYVFERNAGGSENWGQVALIPEPEGGIVLGNFGSKLALSGDYIVVGVPGDGDMGEKAGAVNVFYRNAGGEGKWGFVQKIYSTEPYQALAGVEYGNAIAMTGPLVFVGAYNSGDYQASLPYELLGAVFSYFNYMTETDPLQAFQRLKYNYSLEDMTNGWGSAIATDGKTLVVGMYLGGKEAQSTTGDPGAVIFYDIQ